MKTSKPFSTISYNSVDFLMVKLSELVRRRKIEFFAWVHHLPEEDEKKEHKHLYIVPNGQVNTDEVLNYLLEVDPTHPDKPLGCIRPRSSKFDDWYLYAIHDIDYLASKGQLRKFHYTLEDVVCSDSDYLNEEIHTIDLSALNRSKKLREAALAGISFETLVLNGQIPVQQVYAHKFAYDIMKTFRNGRETHTPKEDPAEIPHFDDETGEIFYKHPKLMPPDKDDDGFTPFDDTK